MYVSSLSRSIRGTLLETNVVQSTVYSKTSIINCEEDLRHHILIHQTHYHMSCIGPNYLSIYLWSHNLITIHICSLIQPYIACALFIGKIIPVMPWDLINTEETRVI